MCTQNQRFHILNPKLNLQCVLPFQSNVCDLPYTARGQSNVMFNQAIFIHSLQKPFQDSTTHERSKFHLTNLDIQAIKNLLQNNDKPQSNHQVQKTNDKTKACFLLRTQHKGAKTNPMARTLLGIRSSNYMPIGKVLATMVCHFFHLPYPQQHSPVELV